MRSKLKILFTSSRPISWVNTAFPFALAYVLLGRSFDVHFFVATLFFLIPYNVLMYGLNDVFDYESDMRNPRKGGVEGGILPKSMHRFIIWSCVLLTAPFIIALGLLGTVQSFLVLLGALFFVVAYSSKGLRFKEIPFLDSITSSLHFVGPLLYALSLFTFPSAAWPFVIAFFLWGVASHAFGAIQDIIPDREAGIHSIATAIGARTTIRIASLCYITATVLIFTQGWMYSAIGLTGLFYVANILPYMHSTDATSAKTRPGWKRFLWLNYITGTVVTITIVCIVLGVY